eukprot:2120893-Pleurochrysis_carterae.AAC.1
MLAVGAEVDASDYDGRTCLMVACATGNMHVVQVLLDAKADPSVKDRWGATALADAVREGHAHVAKMLLAVGASIDLEPSEVVSRLCDYAGAGQLEHLELLLNCKADVDAADYDKRTALHVGARAEAAPSSTKRLKPFAIRVIQATSLHAPS